jgi:hypothetical protein
MGDLSHTSPNGRPANPAYYVHALPRQRKRSSCRAAAFNHTTALLLFRSEVYPPRPPLCFTPCQNNASYTGPSDLQQLAAALLICCAAVHLFHYSTTVESRLMAPRCDGISANIFLCVVAPLLTQSLFPTPRLEIGHSICYSGRAYISIKEAGGSHFRPSTVPTAFTVRAGAWWIRADG